MNSVEAPPPEEAPRPWHNRPIVLVGMMGCGKTTIGKKLASRLNRPFVDSDAAIESAAQMPIPEIFARFGEPHFRDGERRVIARLIEDSRDMEYPYVIATGGGAIVADDTRALVMSDAVCIWLDASIDTLTSRVAKRGNRPLLDGKDARSTLTHLMRKRRQFYEQAHLRVVSNNSPHDEQVSAIVDALNAWEPKA